MCVSGAADTGPRSGLDSHIVLSVQYAASVGKAHSGNTQPEPFKNFK